MFYVDEGGENHMNSPKDNTSGGAHDSAGNSTHSEHCSSDHAEKKCESGEQRVEKCCKSSSSDKSSCKGSCSTEKSTDKGCASKECANKECKESCHQSDNCCADKDNARSQCDAKSASSSDAEDQNDDGTLTPLGQAKQEAAEYLAALQRERADFVNFRNRAERERQQYRQYGVQDVLVAMLPVLDNLDRIAEHEELSPQLAAIQKQLNQAFTKFNVEKFGEQGEDFNPEMHEAILHRHEAGATGPTVDTVAEAGYKVGDRVIRAARVVVVSPEENDKKESQ